VGKKHLPAAILALSKDIEVKKGERSAPIPKQRIYNEKEIKIWKSSEMDFGEIVRIYSLERKKFGIDAEREEHVAAVFLKSKQSEDEYFKNFKTEPARLRQQVEDRLRGESDRISSWALTGD